MYLKKIFSIIILAGIFPVLLLSCNGSNSGKSDNSGTGSGSEDISASDVSSTAPPTASPQPTEEVYTPKKYFTLSFDDGITQDSRIIEILKKYDMYCATFNINTGLCGASWDWVAGAVGCPGLTHIRFTEKELKSGIYDGFEVAVHTLTHPSLTDLSDSAVISEVGDDAKNIKKICGTAPVGMAYPGGNYYNDHIIRLILENTDIRYARTVTSTGKFTLPEYFMEWNPTCSFTEGNAKLLLKKLLRKECTEDMLFYVWCHGYELDAYDKWDEFEEFIKAVSEAEDIVKVTNGEFYQLFKDKIPSWKE